MKSYIKKHANLIQAILLLVLLIKVTDLVLISRRVGEGSFLLRYEKNVELKVKPE